MTPTTEVVEEDEEASSSSSMVHGTTDVMNEAWNAWPLRARKILAGQSNEKASLCTSHTATASLQKLW